MCNYMKEAKAGKKLAGEFAFPFISIPTSYAYFVTLLQIIKGEA